MSMELNIFITLVLPTKSVFKHSKHMPYTTYIDKHGAPMLVVHPGNRPSYPCVKTSLFTPDVKLYILIVNNFRTVKEKIITYL